MSNISQTFAARDKVTEIFEKIINEENKRRNFELYREVFYSSCLTECDRRILYKSIGEKQENSFQLFQKNLQDPIIKKWISFFEKSIKIKIIDKNVIVADCNYNLKGVIDCILNVGELNFIVMIKPLSSNEFTLVKKTARKKDIIETMMNMWMSEVGDGILLYENRDDGEFTTYRILPFVQIIEACKKKCIIMLQNKIKGEIPNRPYKNKEKECLICEFQNKCWEK